MKILIVEDDPFRIVQFKQLFNHPKVFLHIVECSELGVLAAKNIKYDAIFLDHDLGIDPKTGDKTTRVYLDSGDGTGYEVAKECVMCSKNECTPIIVHSFNPVGADKIVDIIPGATKAPFRSPNFNMVVTSLMDYAKRSVDET